MNPVTPRRGFADLGSKAPGPGFDTGRIALMLLDRIAPPFRLRSSARAAATPNPGDTGPGAPGPGASSREDDAPKPVESGWDPARVVLVVDDERSEERRV